MPSREEAARLPDIDAQAAVYEALVADSALLLATCRRCRNSIGYLCRMAAQGQPTELIRDSALRRLMAMTETHKQHRPDTTFDTEEPREE